MTGNWVVPAVQASRQTQYSSTWIGIDGFSNSNLIQTGTEQDVVNGVPQYYAWWEILPSPETPIMVTDQNTQATVQPGDHMSASIQNQGNGYWKIEIADTTRGWTYTTTQAYSGSATSAEWIEEAPMVNGIITPLANYGSLTINPGTVNVNGNPRLVVADAGGLVQGRRLISVPSRPDTDTDGFAAQYGASQPLAPQS
ncbi:G1 family glutamic endopeptidase [Alicyclobacillus sp. ALC3]|uniref:G1 family glutamic endopeptidase n=1 Tax=Alicyclobacillus sp. ALC3 TaxID=2796143 RepID=UPI002377DCD3|nr:G1 family glutamic endopeptidase [Alicyclobacillus sp. ALC3]